ncbi:retrotransposon protein, putative, ty3-gypsy subclass [Tanacetum coccineum]
MQIKSYESFMCRCEGGDVVLRQSHKPYSFGKVYYACPRSKDKITFGNASSFTGLTTPSNSSSHASSSSGSSRAALSPGNTECSNCKLLTMKIKILEARLAMEKNPDNHLCESAAILHELLNEMENLHVECQRMWHEATTVTVAVMISPLHTIYPQVVGVASLTEAKAPKNLIWVEGKRADCTRQETRNLGLKKITDDKGPVPIREMPLYYPSWQKVLAERKVAILIKIGTQFDLKPHMQSQCWTDINAGIQQHLQKLCNTNKASLKAAHWVINPETGTYDVESIRQRRPESITPTDWDAQLSFWNNPRNQARATQNRQNRAKSTVVCRQGSRSLARLRDQMMESLSTREYPSLIDTFFVTHTVGGDEILRLQRLGSNTETGVPYTEEEIMAIVKMTMRLFKSDEKFSQMLDQFESSPEFGGANGSGGCGDDEPGGDEDGDEDEEDDDS